MADSKVSNSEADKNGFQVCVVAGCGRPQFARKWCRAHYERWWRQGALRPEIPIGKLLCKVVYCTVPGCDKVQNARGFCHTHYNRWKKFGDARPDVPVQQRVKDDPEKKFCLSVDLPGQGGGICSVEGCERIVAARGWCFPHYKRWWRRGSVDAPTPISTEYTPPEPCTVDACDNPQYLRGYCNAHYHRWKATGDVRPSVPVRECVKDDPERKFWLSAEVEQDGCWLWKGTMKDNGYGVLAVRGKSEYAHRWAYKTFVGPIPRGYHVDHTCHNKDLSCTDWLMCKHKRCVNPAHLEAVPPRVNSLRGRRSLARTHCRNGHPLSDDNVYVGTNGARNCRKCRTEYYRRVRQQRKDRLLSIAENE